MTDPLTRLRHGEPIGIVAADLGITRRALRQRAARAGILPCVPGRRRQFDHCRIRGLYQELGTYGAVAEIVGCNVTTVRRAVVGRR